MRLTLVVNAWKTVKPHRPLIKFKKGGLRADDPRLTGVHSGEATGHASPATSSAAPGAVTQKPLIEDYQLPAKYRRQPLTEEEMECINSGGRCE